MNAFKEEIPLILSSLACVTLLAIEWNFGQRHIHLPILVE
jgi:hypothetical protein